MRHPARLALATFAMSWPTRTTAGAHLLAIDGKSCESRPASAWNRALWLAPDASVTLTVADAKRNERTIKLP